MHGIPALDSYIGSGHCSRAAVVWCRQNHHHDRDHNKPSFNRNIKFLADISNPARIFEALEGGTQYLL